MLSDKRQATRYKREVERNKNSRNYLSLVVCCLLLNLSLVTCCLSLSHAASPVTVEVRAIPDKAKIGDEIKLFVKIERPKKFTVYAPTEKLKLSPFEIKKVEQMPWERGKNRVQETYALTLTVFELGDLSVPAFPIRYKSDTGREAEVLTEPCAVKIESVRKAKKGAKDELRPIKGPLSFDLTRFWSAVFGIIAFILAVLLAVSIVWRLSRRFVDPESLKPPHERAVLELGRLKKKRYLEEHHHKEYYSELSDILRRYLERQFGAQALEQTSAEVLDQLKDKDFTPEVFNKIRVLFNEADLVKFARQTPERTLGEHLAVTLTQIVDETRPREDKKK